MDDKYLDNVFREKLELPQQHDFDESAWLDLEDRLEDKRKRRIIIPWRWLAAAGIILPILMMSFYFYYELQQTEQQLAKLERKMNNLFKKKEVQTNDDVTIKKSIIPNDSLVENAIVLHQSATKPKSIESAELISSRSQSTSSSSRTSTNNIVTTYTIQSKGNIQAAEIQKDAATDIDKEVIIKEEEKEISSTITLLAKAENDKRAANAIILSPKNKTVSNGFKRQKITSDSKSLNLTYDIETEVKKSLWDKTTAFMTPSGFEVSIGTFRGVKIPKSDFLKTIQDQKPFLENRSIEVAANFINGVDLTVGADFAKYSYITKIIGQDFPNGEPRNTGDIFNHIKVTEDVVQIPIGLRYNFGDYNDVFIPFAEIGGIAKRSVQKHYSFEYLPNSRGDEPYRIKKPQITDENGSFVMNTASGALGIKLNPKMKNQVLDNVVIQAEAFLNADFETPESTLTAGAGLSLSYTF
ncbi:MAG: hypothetical protein AB8G11_11180 [Saprospiraceae bacterium]